MTEKVVPLTISARPDFSKNYPAIDGIAKGERPPASERSSERSSRGHFSPAEEAIRSDLLPILGLPEAEFQNWFGERHQVCLEELRRWERIGSIPDLRFGSDSFQIGGSSAHVRNLIQILREGLDYLEKIRERWREIQEE